MHSAICTLFVYISWTQTSQAGLVAYLDEAHPILYPGPTKEPLHNKWGDDFGFQNQLIEFVPEECKDQNFCTVKPKNYPQAKFNSYFHGSTFVPQPSEDMEGNRQGDPSEKDDCDSVVTFEPLYKVKSRKDEWRTVVQSPENNFVQKVRLETCKNPGGTCFNVFPHVPNFVTSCKQKYNIWELMVEGVDGPETIKVDLPVCCQCIYKASSLG